MRLVASALASDIDSEQKRLRNVGVGRLFVWLRGQKGKEGPD